MSEVLAAERPQPKLSDQVAELERQLLLHRELIRDKQQQIDTLRGELNSIRQAAIEATGKREYPSAKAAADYHVSWLQNLRDNAMEDRCKYMEMLNRIPLFIRRIWGAV